MIQDGDATWCVMSLRLYLSFDLEYRRMVVKKHAQEKLITLHEVITYQEQLANFKDSLFTVLDAHLQQNGDAPSYPFYIFLLLEHLALLWYIIHPGLNIYSGVYLASQVNTFLKCLNFHEFLTSNADLYRPLVMIVFVFLVVQVLLTAVSAFAVLKQKSGEIFKYLKKLVNYLFLFTAKAASGPVLALCLNVLYCNPANNYHVGQTCYDSQYVMVSIAATLSGLIVLIEVLLFALIYYSKSPLTSSYMGVSNRYYILSKTLIKLLMPLYYTVDPTLSLSIVYMFSVTGLLGIYLFWHRLFSVHSYNQRHFYVQYFLQALLFWMALSNLIYYYAEGGIVFEEFAFVYTLISAMFVSFLLMSIQARFEESFAKECLASKVKKQNMQKFIYVLINKFLYCNISQSKLMFKVYYKVLITTYGIDVGNPPEHEQEHRIQVYRFLSKLIDVFLVENNSIMLKAIKCSLSCLLQLKSYGVHQALELEEQRLSLIEEFMLFQFRKGIDLFENQGSNKENRQFLKFYRFHQEFGCLETYVEACSKNSAEYLQQLCESDPSMAKLRNLATLHTLYNNKITEQYQKINDLVPQSIYTANLYFGFLMSSGVDVRATIKMKEKLNSILEQKVKSSKISREDLKEDEETSIITLDTVGNNLGVVLNANSHVKDLLGFDKKALMGKNITKLMPKIYTELHNTFMLNFIRSEDSHQRSSNKLVTALNKDSLLVEIDLSVRILNSSQSDLAIVGFMKPIEIQPFKGLVMYSANNGEVLGINENFMEMMNRRLTGRQVAQEEVKIAVLAPELNMELLEKEKQQETLLEVGSSLEDQGDLQVQKKIRVTLKSIKLYQGVKLGFLEIIDLNLATKQLYGQRGSKLSYLPNKQSIGKMSSFNMCERRRKMTEDYSLNISESQRAINQPNAQGLNRELPTARRKEEFIKSREGGKLAWILKAIYAICIIGCSSAALYTNFTHASYLSDRSYFYLSMNQTLSLPYFQAEINTYVAKIWNINTQNYFDSTYRTYTAPLNTFIMNLKRTYSEITTKLSQYSYPLQYNEVNTYLLTFAQGNNGSLEQTTRNGTYSDAISNYITAANAFTQDSINNASLTTKTILQMQAIYICQNGEDLLPSIGRKATNKYMNYYLDTASSQMKLMMALKIVMMAVIIACFLGMVALGHFLNGVNAQVLQVYSKIKFADIYELLGRYNKFLEQKGFKANLRQRTIETIKSPTIKDEKPEQEEEEEIIVRSAQVSIRELAVQSNQWPVTLPTEEPLNTHTNQSRLLTFEDAAIEQEEVAEAEQAQLQEKQAEPTVSIQEERSSKKIIITLSIFFLIFAGLLVLSCILISINFDSLEEYMKRLKVIGQTKITLNLIDFYSYRVAYKQQEVHNNKLLNSQIQEFYRLTQQGYIYLGDPSPILKNTYSLVQTVQQWLTPLVVTDQAIINANYTFLDQGLQGSISDINDIDTFTYYPQFTSEIANGIKNQLIITLSLIVFIFFAVFFVHTLYLAPIRLQGKHSLNMLRILPSWMLQRNPKALKMISV